MSKQLELAVRRILEVVLVVATVVTAYAAVVGQLSASVLGALVPALIAISVILQVLDRGQRGRCIPGGGR
jgi:hypothetical protein